MEAEYNHLAIRYYYNSGLILVLIYNLLVITLLLTYAGFIFSFNHSVDVFNHLLICGSRFNQN